MTIHAILPDGKRVDLNVKGSDSVYDLKLKIQTQENIPANNMQLDFGGNVMSINDQALTQYGVVHSSVISVSTLSTDESGNLKSPPP